MSNEQYNTFVNNLLEIKDYCADIRNLIGTGQCYDTRSGDPCEGCEADMRIIRQEIQNMSTLIDQTMELYNETRSTHD